MNHTCATCSQERPDEDFTFQRGKYARSVGETGTRDYTACKYCKSEAYRRSRTLYFRQYQRDNPEKVASYRNNYKCKRVETKKVLAEMAAMDLAPLQLPVEAASKLYDWREDEDRGY